MKCHKFTPKQWVIFDYGLGTAIGFTAKQGNLEVINFTSDCGETGVIPFAKVENLRRLHIESKQSNYLRQIAAAFPDTIISLTKGEA